MSALQLEAYRTAKNSGNMSGREIEAAALTRCAIMLSDCQKNWESPNRDNELDEALRTNQRVWTILQSELVRPDNALPKQLKEDLLTLSVFIDKRIIQVMANPEPDKLNILIDINLNIAAGLNAKADNSEKEAATTNVIPIPEKRFSRTGIRA
ncbi:MAG TPA: flagellar biosynthesis regulator FlaF [Smithellaceae bacterium]|nr:flagellar biosynthesis regulator FlaF [Smithellaceae bacterium]